MGLICLGILGLSRDRNPVDQREQTVLVEQIGRADGTVAADVVERGADPLERDVRQRAQASR